VPLRYLLDEHLRGPLGRAMEQHNAAGGSAIDAVRVGDRPDLPLGSGDPELLRWAEREGRILVSWDKRSLPGHLARHLQAGHHVPGIFLLREHFTIPQVLAYLVQAAATDPLGWQDRIAYIP
jgi:hypothetical protein